MKHREYIIMTSETEAITFYALPLLMKTIDSASTSRVARVAIRKRGEQPFLEDLEFFHNVFEVYSPSQVVHLVLRPIQGHKLALLTNLKYWNLRI